MHGKRWLIAFGILILVAALVFLVVSTSKPKTVARLGGYRLVYAVELAPEDPPETMQSLFGALERRVDPSGIAGLEWRELEGNRFEVRVPRSSKGLFSPKTEYWIQPDEMKKLMAMHRGKLEFRIAASPEGKAPADDELRLLKGQLMSEGAGLGRKRGDRWQWFKVNRTLINVGSVVEANDGSSVRHVLLAGNAPNDTLLSGRWQLARAAFGSDAMGRPAVNFTFDERGAAKFGDLTSRHIDLPLAILLDDEMYSAPTIKSTIREHGQITGTFTRAEVDDLVKVLKVGPLPVPISPAPLLEEKIEPHAQSCR
ncbi:MAG: hypothetical protein LLG01_08535 [Planctomycetaceae bacterium]|nr:hypothetical protein [Planctomycetaceae bacterium]